MKKVIFVASTSYSGSTFLDMTLGNDPAGFSIGEVNALFEPTKPHHYTPVCGCHQQTCTLWEQMRRLPVTRLYTAVFEKFPAVNFIVDSSKDPLWINKRIKELTGQGIDYRIALIWKSPLEIAHSFDKRGDYHNWQRSWVNYHRLLYTLQPANWTTINYSDYTSDPASLEQFCQSLDIPYFPGKERFWEKTHHLLFGNHSARKHLIQSHKDNQQAESMNNFQTIVHTPVQDSALETRVAADMQTNPVIGQIQSILESLAGGKSEAVEQLNSVKMGFTDIKLRQLKHWLQLIKGKTLSPRFSGKH